MARNTAGTASSRDQVRAGVGEVTHEPGGGPLAHRHHPVPAGLGLPQGEPAPGQVDVGEVEADQLAPAHGGGVEQLHHGAVPQPDDRGRVGDGQHRLGFGVGERGLGQLVALAWHHQLGGRVVEHALVLVHQEKKTRSATSALAWVDHDSGVPSDLRRSETWRW